jgi:hypothetical protein
VRCCIEGIDVYVLDRTLKLSSQFCIELIQHNILVEVWIAMTLNLSYYFI